PIAREQNRRPMWPPERVEALKDPNSRPEFGGEFHPPVDYHRPYLEDEVPSTPPLLTVFTHPPGMTVKVDGQLRGRTPYVLPLTGEEKRMEVELSGAGFITQRTSLTPDKEDGAFRWNTVMALDPSVKRAPAK
ncbi:MAG: PEGA domain-containing protein, partial [Myxococcales bacterium]|nr:PEGA domain-containing protein [Myxococcales bacterium]